MAENQENRQPGESRAFQSSARSRKRVIKEHKWLILPLVLLVLILAAALYLVIRYTAIHWSEIFPTQPITTAAPAMIRIIGFL